MRTVTRAKVRMPVPAAPTRLSRPPRAIAEMSAPAFRSSSAHAIAISRPRRWNTNAREHDVDRIEELRLNAVLAVVAQLAAIELVRALDVEFEEQLAGDSPHDEIAVWHLSDEASRSLK